ncbi:hypothetical protein [Neisseria sp.]|uniref:hypothetical protein n=1 Tax=Neisseria sp. TaxID=192066 RepID=UPI00359FCBE7
MPNQQLTLSPASLQMLDDFRKQPDVLPEHYQNLMDALTASPFLTKQFNTAVAEGRVAGFKALDPSVSAGGNFDPVTKKISLPLGNLTNSAFQVKENKYDMVFVLAHEIQHGLNDPEQQKATHEFFQAIDRKARQPAVRDYTEEIQSLLASFRRDEASAEIAGFNALVSAANPTNNPANIPSWAQLYGMAWQRMEDFIAEEPTSEGDFYSLKGIVPNADMTLSEEKNLDVMGRNYFDKGREEVQLANYCPPTGCQLNDYVDYYNHYGSWIVGQVITAERRHNPNSKEPLVLDMVKSRLTEEMLEENGLWVDGQTMPYKDIGKNPPVLGTFNHTYDGAQRNTWIPIAYGRGSYQEWAAQEKAVADPQESKLDALFSKYGKLLEAAKQDDHETFRQANRQLIADSPTASRKMAEFDTAAEMNRLQAEEEKRRFSLGNMPQRAQELYGQIDTKLRAYYDEHKLPYTEHGMRNSVAALTAEAYAKRMPAVQDVGVSNDGRVAAWHETRAHRFSDAVIHAEKAAATPARESFEQTLQAQERLAEEDRRRELERQMERQHSYGMSR